MDTTTRVIRQGLPRHPGAEPWPPADAFGQASVTTPTAPPVNASSKVQQTTVSPDTATVTPVTPTTATVSTSNTSFARNDVRQGLPRKAGGDPWPPVSPVADTPAPAPKNANVPLSPAATAPQSSETETTTSTRSQTSNTNTQVSADTPEPKKLGPLTLKQWVPVIILGAFSVLGMATALVLGARWLLNIETIAQFVATYPGEYDLPESAPVGFPAWMGWQHFFNVFLIVLIIRTGLQVRHQQKPPAYWSSKHSPKVNINLWLHQTLDVLWLVNGIVFIALLFGTGHWMRIVPTSWEVFPNALSAALQYMSLDWPTENGWVNYNALQELAYFVTVFIAAPLAAITGYRMSAFWPKKAATLNRAYPVEVARKLHFPVMIYFVVFIFTHVALVFSTGALRNLNHMYAAQGSADPTQYAENWTGFWLFAASLLVIGLAWVACRPLLLAPIARLFGTVSSR